MDINNISKSKPDRNQAALSIGHVNNITTMQFSLEFPETLSQNLICYH